MSKVFQKITHKRTVRIFSRIMLIGISIVVIVLFICLSIDAAAPTISTPPEVFRPTYIEETIPFPPIKEPEAEVKKQYGDNDVELIAKVLYAECRGVRSTTEQACVVWTILNRVDAGQGDIEQVVTKPSQFAYRKNSPVTESLKELAIDVLDRWSAEKSGEENTGRVLPENYLYFYGDGTRNYFRDAYRNGNIWDYSLESPYES